jgi:HK97 family phage portal protein
MAKKALLQRLWNSVIYNPEARSLENPNTPLTGANLIFGGGETEAGAIITPTSALSIPAYLRANEVLNTTISTLPIGVYEKKDGGITLLENHYLTKLLSQEPNSQMSSVSFREAGQGSLNTFGNFYGKIIRNGAAKVTEIIPLHDNDVTPKMNKGRLVYDVINEDGKTITYIPRDIFHIPGFSYNGLVGFSKLDLMRQTLGLAKTYEEKASAFIRNDSTPPIALIGKGQMTEPQKLQNKKNWQEANTQKNSGKAAVLTGDWDIKQLSITPDQAQFLQSREFSIGDIARFTGVPPHLLYELGRATYNNIEQQNSDFANFTVQGWVDKWEQECNRKLLSPSEKQKGYAVEMSMHSLYRADAKSRGELYKALKSVGALKPNDARKMEQMNPLPDGNETYVQMQDIALSHYDEYITSVVASRSQQTTKTEDNEQ